MKRRNFLRNSALSTLGALASIESISGLKHFSGLSPIRIGICADIHMDTVYDGKERLKSFINSMVDASPDFIIQLGDFCGPKEKNRECLEIWNKFSGQKYHVIGNHDVDGGFSKKEVTSFLEMPDNYYSFDAKGYHFIVLDANDDFPNRDPRNKYWAYVGDEQLSWIERDLEKSKAPVIVFTHQGLDNDLGGIENSVKVRAMFDRHNQKTKDHKIRIIFSGHQHQDYYNVINGIHYIQINSMSYQWLGKKYAHVPYTEEINQKYTWTKYTAPYKDPLWALLEISSNGIASIKGMRTNFVGKTPKELGVAEYPDGYPCVATITDRKIKIE
ncbi:MAG: metallophosphoesterase [Ginsengibacter sp.]